MGDGNIQDQEDRIGGGMERESNERDILIEGAIVGLGRNLALEKFSGIHKDDPG